MNKGKAKCEKLKAIRRAIAEANNIDYNPTECTYEGECNGTCPKCDAEVESLNKILAQKEAKGEEVVIPEINLDNQDIIPEKMESDEPYAPKESRIVDGMVKIGDLNALEELRRKLRKERNLDCDYGAPDTEGEKIMDGGMQIPLDFPELLLDFEEQKIRDFRTTTNSNDDDTAEGFSLEDDIILDEEEFSEGDELEGEEGLLGDILLYDKLDEEDDFDEQLDDIERTPRSGVDVIFDDEMFFDPKSGKFIPKEPSSLIGLIDKNSDEDDK